MGASIGLINEMRDAAEIVKDVKDKTVARIKSLQERKTRSSRNRNIYEMKEGMTKGYLLYILTCFISQSLLHLQLAIANNCFHNSSM